MLEPESPGDAAAWRKSPEPGSERVMGSPVAAAGASSPVVMLDMPVFDPETGAERGGAYLLEGSDIDSSNDGPKTGGEGPTTEEEEEDPFQGAVRRFYHALVDLSSGEKDALGGVLQELSAMHAEIYLCPDEQLKAINQEILADCERKAGQSLLDLLRKATSAVAPDPDAAYELFHQCVRLRQEHKAANIYGGFLSRRLSDVAGDALKALTPVRSIRRLQLGGATQGGEGVNQPHVSALATILGEASRLLSLLSANVGDGHGLGHEGLVKMSKALNDIAVRDVLQILEWYKEDADLRRYQERCLDRSTHLNIQDLDFALEELKNLCGLCNRYTAYLGPELATDLQPLTFQLKELVSLYVCMESAYCSSSVGKALSMGRPIDIADGVYISTIVEDVPEIVRGCLERSMETLDDMATMAVGNAAIELLGPDAVPSFHDALMALIHDRSLETPRSPGREGGGGMDELSRALERALEEEEGGYVAHSGMVYALNSLDCANTAINKMRDLLVRYRSTRGGAGAVIDDVVDEVARISKLYDRAFDAFVTEFVDTYMAAGVLPYMQSIVSQSEYEVDSATYEADVAGKDAFVTQFLDFMFCKDKVLRDCRQGMTERSLVRFAEKVATRLSDALLDLLRPKRFTEWGAMKLRNQIRLLQARMAEILDGQGTLLPQFASVDSMVHLLNLESPADLLYYHRSNSGALLADEAEVRQILRMRVEFDHAQIDAIRLPKPPPPRSPPAPPHPTTSR